MHSFLATFNSNFWKRKIHPTCILWYHGLSNFQERGAKSDRFLAKNNFWHRKLTLKVRFLYFLTTRHYVSSQIGNLFVCMTGNEKQPNVCSHFRRNIFSVFMKIESIRLIWKSYLVTLEVGHYNSNANSKFCVTLKKIIYTESFDRIWHILKTSEAI